MKKLNLINLTLLFLNINKVGFSTLTTSRIPGIFFSICTCILIIIRYSLMLIFTCFWNFLGGIFFLPAGDRMTDSLKIHFLEEKRFSWHQGLNWGPLGLKSKAVTIGPWRQYLNFDENLESVSA